MGSHVHELGVVVEVEWRPSENSMKVLVSLVNLLTEIRFLEI